VLSGKYFVSVCVQLEKLVQRLIDQSKGNGPIAPLIKQAGTREERHFSYMLECWRETSAEVLDIDKKLKTKCGHTDFLKPGWYFLKVHSFQ